MANTKKKSRNFERPDERREFKGHGHLDLLVFDDGLSIGRAEFEPGWRWSNDVKPIAGTELCEAAHSGYCLEGSMTVQMKDGETFTVREGEAYQIPPGHDAWVEGGKCVLVDITGFQDYAKPEAKKKAG